MCRSGLASTDILVLVISAEDGIWPQTLKIIDSFQGKKDVMSLIVAVTKIDKVQDRVEDAHQKIEWELMEHQIFPEQIQMVPLSAKTREGLTDLMEAIQMQAESIELKSSVFFRKNLSLEGNWRCNLNDNDNTIIKTIDLLCYIEDISDTRFSELVHFNILPKESH